MAKRFLTVENYAGRRLTGGSFYQWMARMHGLFASIESDSQQYLNFLSDLSRLLNKLAQLIKLPGAFADTPAVVAADNWRDHIFSVIFMHIYYCALLPVGSCLSAAGKKLYPQVKPYKKLQSHEMTLETTEIQGFLRVLNADENAEAVATLGLTEAVIELGEQNAIIQAEMVKREQEDAARKQLKDGETVGSLRKQIEPVYEALVMMVNAFSVMGNQSAAAVVPEMNAVIDHYQQIQAQKDGGGVGSDNGGGSSSGSNESNGINGNNGNNGGNGNSEPDEPANPNDPINPSDPGTGSGGTGGTGNSSGTGGDTPGGSGDNPGGSGDNGGGGSTGNGNGEDE